MVNAGARARFFYVLLNGLIIALVWWAADRAGLMWIVPIMLSINVVLLTYGQFLEFSNLEAEEISGFDRWGLYKIIQPLVTDLGIARPRIYLMPLQTPQALCYARTQKDSHIYLSAGLLDRLEEDELRAVVAQQLVAIKLQAGVGFYFLGATTDLIYRAGRFFDICFGWIFGWSPSLSAWPLSPCIWLLQRLFLPHNIYRQIDKLTAEILQKPEVLARALWKLESYAKTHPMPQQNLYVWSHMCAVSPLWERRPVLWLKTQPPMKSRIKSLVGYFPI